MSFHIVVSNITFFFWVKLCILNKSSKKEVPDFFKISMCGAYHQFVDGNVCKKFTRSAEQINGLGAITIGTFVMKELSLFDMWAIN